MLDILLFKVLRELFVAESISQEFTSLLRHMDYSPLLLITEP